MAVKPTASEQGPRLTDQLDQVVALRTDGEHREVDHPQYGKSEAMVAEAFFGLGTDGLDPVYVPECLVFGQVVQRQVAEAAGEWLIGKLIRPGRAYQITTEGMSDEEWSAAEARLDAELTPTEA